MLSLRKTWTDTRIWLRYYRLVWLDGMTPRRGFFLGIVLAFLLGAGGIIAAAIWSASGQQPCGTIAGQVLSSGQAHANSITGSHAYSQQIVRGSDGLRYTTGAPAAQYEAGDRVTIALTCNRRGEPLMRARLLGHAN